MAYIATKITENFTSYTATVTGIYVFTSSLDGNYTATIGGTAERLYYNANYGVCAIFWAEAGQTITTSRANYCMLTRIDGFVTKPLAVLKHYIAGANATCLGEANKIYVGMVSDWSHYNPSQLRYSFTCPNATITTIAHSNPGWSRNAMALIIPGEDNTITVSSYTGDNYIVELIGIGEVTVTVSPENSGIVSGQGVYNYGETATIEATPNIGYAFEKWHLDGYTRLDYIESSGTQWIDTGISASQVIDLTIKAKISWSTLPADAGFISVKESSGDTRRYFAYGYQQKWCFGVNTLITTDVSIVQDQIYEVETKLKSGNSYMKVDGTTIATSTATLSNTGSKNLGIFCLNNYDSAQYFAEGKLYEFEALDGSGNQIRNYIPVIRHSDGAIGLLDLVEMKFYGNSGTGNFLSGDIIYPLADNYQTFFTKEEDLSHIETFYTTLETGLKFSAYKSGVNATAKVSFDVDFTRNRAYLFTYDTNSYYSAPKYLTCGDYSFSLTNQGRTYTPIVLTQANTGLTTGKCYLSLYRASGNSGYVEGRVANILAIPITDNKIVFEDNPLSFQVYEDISLVANFSLSYIIIINYNDTLGNAYYRATQGSVTFTAIPFATAQFLGWYIDNQLINSNLIFEYIVESDITIEARFEKIYEITTSVIGKGELTYTRGSNDKNLITFTANPGLISRFVKFKSRYYTMLDYNIKLNNDILITQDNDYLIAKVGTWLEEEYDYDTNPLTIQVYADTSMTAYFEEVFICIYDREIPDVNRVKELNEKLQKDNYTQAELNEWKTEMKGSLNRSDLTRVRDNTKYLALRLGVTITAQDEIPEIPTEEFYEVMLNNVKTLKDAWMTYEETPDLPIHPLNYYYKWNIIEKTLWDIYSILNSGIWYHAGIDLMAGDNILI